MSVTVANLGGGAAFAIYNSKQIQFLEDASISMAPETAILSSALYGDYDEIPTDLVIKAIATPRYYDTANLATMFPYIGAVARGTFYGGGNVVCDINSENGDQYILNNAIIGKMPDLTLGMDGAIIGPMEFWGLIQSGMDPTNTAAYYTFNPSGGSYTYAVPSLPNTALIGQQEYTAAYDSVTGLTSFQAQEKWTISHELKWAPVKIQGRTRAFRLQSYRCMAKCKPADATMAHILAAANMQGANAVQGTSLAQLAYAADSSAYPDLVITGTSSISVTVKAAAIKTAGFIFDNKQLRQGEVGWVSTQTAAGALTAPLVLS